MEVQEMTYVIITPTKNEERYIEATLRSVVHQTVLPKRWIVLNDGSSDRTAEIITSYCVSHPWIELITLDNFETGLYTTGGRSGALMNYARQLIAANEVEFIVKIDSDIAFEPDFFERLFQELRSDDKLGLVSGHLKQDGVPEAIGFRSSIRGATRIYKKACFDQIEFFYTSRGEDEMDTYKAQYLGWKTRTFDVFFDHLKPEGIRNNWIKRHYETGAFKAWIPYRFSFFLATVLKNIRVKPFVFGSIVQLYAYCHTRFIKRERPFEKAVCDFVRTQQKQRMNAFLVKQKTN